MHLTYTKVQYIVSHNTDLEVESVAELGDGFDFRTFLVNSEWVFRFPKRWENADTLTEERSILRNLRTSDRIPKFEYWLEKPSGYQMPIAGYRMIKGIALESLDDSANGKRRLAQQLASFLNELHSQILESTVQDSDPLWTYLCNFDDDLKELAQFIPLKEVQLLRSYVGEYRTRKSVSDLVATHGDLGVEHIFVSPGMSLNGVVDWSKASSTCRFLDFFGLWGWGGDRFLCEIFSNYLVKPSVEDWAQIRVLGLIYCVGRVLYSWNRKSNALFTIAVSRSRKRIQEIAGKNPYCQP